MNKILGSQELINKAKSATPQNKNIYINYEALEELPDQFEAVISAVKFDPNKLDQFFSEVGGGKWMPNTDLMYKIAEAKGISGDKDSIVESVYEEVDINPMLCRGFEDAPTYRRIKVGEKVTKLSTVMEEDGTFRKSSPCTQVYNVWDRCKELWSKEEEQTNGYAACKQGNYQDSYGNQRSGFYIEKTYQGKTYGQGTKYGSKFARQSHFNSEMKFAMAKAETKAYLKTIRELAGLMTGYTKHDLQSGELLFAKIRKSSESLKLEQAAHLSRLSHNNNTEDHTLLFGKTQEKNVTEVHDEKLTPVQEAIKEIEEGLESDKVIPDFKTAIGNVLGWLKDNPEADKSQHWEDVQNKINTMRGMINGN